MNRSEGTGGEKGSLPLGGYAENKVPESCYLQQMERWVRRVAGVLNWAAGGFVLAMMLLTASDVILRLFRLPLTGTYDLVGLLGAAFVSFALAYTSLQKGHIAVDFMVRKLRPRTQLLVDTAVEVLSLGLFTLVSWQALFYARRLRLMGEVSLTLKVPLYPFVYGVAVGSGMLCVVLLLRVARDLLSFRGKRLPQPPH